MAPPAGSPRPNVDLAETKQPQIWAAIITSLMLATLAVGLRFLSRRLKRSQFWLDDWLILASLVPLTGMLGHSIYWIHCGMGKHYELAGPDVYGNFFKGLFIGWIIYTITICLVKFSILALYWRIFQYTSIRVPIWILTAITAGWGIAVLLVTIFQCDPVSAFWNRKVGSQCNIHLTVFFPAVSVINTVVDIAILILPIPFVMSLSRNIGQKLVVCGIFLSGSFVVIISLIRLVYLCQDNINDPDVTWESAPIEIWTMPECAVAITSGCLPCLRPIFCLLVTGHLPSPDVGSNTAGCSKSGEKFSIVKFFSKPTRSISSRYSGKHQQAGERILQNQLVFAKIKVIPDERHGSDSRLTYAGDRNVCWEQGSSLEQSEKACQEGSDVSSQINAVENNVEMDLDVQSQPHSGTQIGLSDLRDLEKSY